MKTRFIKSPEKKRITQKLNEQFGISKIPHLLIESGKEKIRGYSGHLSKDEIKDLSVIINIETLGLYLIKKETQGLRLSIEAVHFFQDQIKKNIININAEELQEWIRGRYLELEHDKGIVIIQHDNDFIGSGISTGEKILNFIPKDRRIK